MVQTRSAFPFSTFIELATEHFGFGANPEKVGGKCREPYSKGQEELCDGNVDGSVCERERERSECERERGRAETSSTILSVVLL